MAAGCYGRTEELTMQLHAHGHITIAQETCIELALLTMGAADDVCSGST